MMLGIAKGSLHMNNHISFKEIIVYHKKHWSLILVKYKPIWVEILIDAFTLVHYHCDGSMR